MITENKNNCFRFNFKKTTNLGNLLKNFQNSWITITAYNETSRDLYKRHRRFFSKTYGCSKSYFSYRRYVVGLYPSIPNSEGLDILKKQYEEYPNKKLSTEDVGKMADFVLKNSFFGFGSKFSKQIPGTAIGTKFAPPYACIFMDHSETEFLKTQDIKPWFWKGFIDDIFLYVQKMKRAEKKSLRTSINSTLFLSLLQKNPGRKLTF